jgi:hypothetical protein
MTVPSLNELAVMTVDTPDHVLVQMQADYLKWAKESQTYADRFNKLIKHRKRAKRRGVALPL